MNGQPQLGDISALRYFGLLAVVAGLMFALIDDAPTGPGAFLVHALQWQFQTCVPMALLVMTQMLTGRFGLQDRLNPWLRLGLSALVATVVFAPLALGLDIVLGDGNEAFSWRALGAEYLAMAPPVVLFWLAINVPWLLGFRVNREPSAIAEEPGPAQPAFYDLLEPEMRGELLYLKAELHYLAVVTSAGRSLVLYNLRDAITELAPDAGIQCHRSYWVARDQVEALRRQGRQGELLMKNGDIVPISRRSLAEVEAGLGPASIVSGS